MIELPFNIFGQELFNMSREEFINNMMDMNHFIDPYLYYRGLEELFNVNIFVFSSVRNRQNPSSMEEYYLTTPSLEIPHCKEYHSRKYIQRGIVCLFKNYGTNRTKYATPSCELIAINRSEFERKEESVVVFDYINTRFQTSIWTHFYKCCHPITFEINKSELTTYDNIFNDWDPNSLGLGPVIGQELDIYGKASLLIYKDWNVVVPGIQPLNFATEIPRPRSIISNGTPYIHNGYTFMLCYDGMNERVELKSKSDCIKTFEVTEHDDEGCWIEFQGNKRGLKILCKPDKEYMHIKYHKIEGMIDDLNKTSALLQLINWLWRSEYNGSYPNFEEWFNSKVFIDDESMNKEIGQPRTFLNNLYLPKFNDYEERINYCTNIWPFFFRHGKIFLTTGLYKRIMNIMKIQDKYTYYMTPDNFYSKINNFIVGLIPSEEDFKKGGNFIFDKKEHLKHWINYTNRSIYHQVSLMNMNIVNNKIYDEYSNYVNPYIFKDKNSKIYIVQNIYTEINNDKALAVEVAYQWKLRRYNIGPYHKNRETSFPPKIHYVLFGIDENNHIVPIEDKSEGQNDYLSILVYKEGKYAALLPKL